MRTANAIQHNRRETSRFIIQSSPYGLSIYLLPVYSSGFSVQFVCLELEKQKIIVPSRFGENAPIAIMTLKFRVWSCELQNATSCTTAHENDIRSEIRLWLEEAHLLYLASTYFLNSYLVVPGNASLGRIFQNITTARGMGLGCNSNIFPVAINISHNSNIFPRPQKPQSTLNSSRSTSLCAAVSFYPLYCSRPMSSSLKCHVIRLQRI